MERTRRSWVRGAVVLGLSGTMMAAALMSPALAGKFATKKFVKAQINQAIGAFRTEAEGRFLDTAEADARYIPDTITVRESSPFSIPSGGEAFMEMECPAGMRVTGGGGYTSQSGMYITASYPSDGTRTDTTGTSAWTVWAENASGTTGELYSYAICVRADATLLRAAATRTSR